MVEPSKSCPMSKKEYFMMCLTVLTVLNLNLTTMCFCMFSFMEHFNVKYIQKHYEKQKIFSPFFPSSEKSYEQNWLMAPKKSKSNNFVGQNLKSICTLY